MPSAAMWSNSLANLKENLHRITSEIYSDDDEDGGGGLRRSSGRGVSSSPVANGFHSPPPSSNPELEQYKAEIRRLQESEAQIKALSVNYAALLKEKEEKISRLNEENGSLKQRLDATKRESFRISTGRPTVVKNGANSIDDGLGNGTLHSRELDIQNKQESRHSSSRVNEKELSDLVEEKNRTIAAIQSKHSERIRQLELELDKERGNLTALENKLKEEQKLNKSFQEELKSSKLEKNELLVEINEVRDELAKRSSEIGQLQMELSRNDNTKSNDVLEGLKRVVATLEKENGALKIEKDQLKAALEASDKLSKTVNEEVELSAGFPGKEEMELSLQKQENDLRVAHRDRYRALQELNRLKQHLLDKESEESEKMDEDSKIIEGLREENEYLKDQIRHLEKSLKQAVVSLEEVKLANSNELQKSKEINNELNKKLASCTSTIDAKNIELLNLQTALGQYYAEIEAKEHLEGVLASAREESARLSEHLKDAYQQIETSKKEKEEYVAKLSQAERMMAEGKVRLNKIEEDNEKLRRALEQSMTRLNRMSMDSDYSVDRRIVIKLLVTYFQRNHSKEVLDLMVRMLGFSDEDKQRIGVAQQGAGKGVVRGVFGLPGRLVGGILGGSSAEGPTNLASDNQSFADMWVDFLLKETEERERRESSKNANGSQDNQHEANPQSIETSSPAADRRFSISSSNQYQSPISSRGSLFQPEQSDSEFSTVPLNSSDSNSQLSRLLPRY